MCIRDRSRYFLVITSIKHICKSYETKVQREWTCLLYTSTKGPEIRTGVLKGGKRIMLKAGEQFTLTTEEIEGDESKDVSYTHLR